MAHCEVMMNNSDCVDPISEGNGTRKGKVTTTCHGCGTPACSKDSRTVSRKEMAAGPPSLRSWLGRRICNDCRSQNDFPMVGTDYEGL